MHRNEPNSLTTTDRKRPPCNAHSGERMCEWLDRMGNALRRSYLESTRALVAAVEAKDSFTERHSARVSTYARQIGARMGLDDECLGSLETAAMLHDIGKIGVPDAILNKPGALTEEEFALVRKHPSIAVEILGHTTYLAAELPVILHHHERYDGMGYPAGLSGDRIPLGARIINVADSLDTMLTRRSYKGSVSLREARMELVRCRGKQFDPGVVDAALAWLDDAAAALTTGPECEEWATVC